MRLHSKHGVAPVLTSCQVCGKDGESVVLLGSAADSTMKKLHEQTNGRLGSPDGYRGSSVERILHGYCHECGEHLAKGGAIFIADDLGQFLKMTKEQLHDLHGRIGHKDKALDLISMQGKVSTVPKAFWKEDSEGMIRMRDPKEWML